MSKLTLNRRHLLFGGAAATGLLSARWLLMAKRGYALDHERLPDIPSAATGSLDFLVAGDTGQEREERQRVVNDMNLTAQLCAPSFALLTGDNIYPHGVTSARDEQFEVHFQRAFDRSNLAIPFYPCLGNHDHEGVIEAQFEYSELNEQWRLPSSHHSFVAPITAEQHAEFFVLDTTSIREEFLFAPSEQASWLEDALERSTATWKIGIGHHPLHTGGDKGASSKCRHKLGGIFHRAGLDFYLSGHKHTQELVETGDGWFQIVSGAGAAPRPADEAGEALFKHPGEGFTRMSLRPDEAWVQFRRPGGAKETFRFEKVFAS